MDQDAHSIPATVARHITHDYTVPGGPNDTDMIYFDTHHIDDPAAENPPNADADGYVHGHTKPLNDTSPYGCGGTHADNSLDCHSWHVPVTTHRRPPPCGRGGRRPRPQRRGSITKHSIQAMHSARKVQQSCEGVTADNKMVMVDTGKPSSQHTSYQRVVVSDCSDTDSTFSVSSLSLSSLSGHHPVTRKE